MLPTRTSRPSAALRCLAALTLLLVWSVLPGQAGAQPTDHGEYVGRVLQLTNEERARAGLQPLVANPQLMHAAQGYSDLMAGTGCFSHGCGPTPELARRLEAAGYEGWSNVGENIAMGYSTPEQVVSAWMESPGHRANILNPRFAEIGVGYAPGGSRYWAQEFGFRRGVDLLALQAAVVDVESADGPLEEAPTE